MYFDTRLWAMTRGTRPRIALCALLGLLGLAAGIARFALLGQFLARLFAGAPVAALWPPLAGTAAVIVLRGWYVDVLLAGEKVDFKSPASMNAFRAYEALVKNDLITKGLDGGGAIGAFLNGGGISQISTIVRELDAALHGRAARGKALIARLNGVLGELNAHSAAIDDTLQALADVSGRLAAQHRLLVRGLRELQPGIKDLHADTAAFTELLTRLSTLGLTATQVLDSVQGTLLTDLDDLAPTLDTLVSLRGKLGSTLQGLLDFARLLNRAIPGDYLNLVGTIKVP